MTSRTKEEPKAKEIPDVVIDPSTKRKFIRGKFLGKGGFARCYELTDMQTNEIFAGKIVSKSLLTKQNQKEKMSQEIQIHRDLFHKHIVKFYTFFEDSDNVYVILELCRRRSLMELHKRRKCLTDIETKYFMRQILYACIYLHENRIIHRDLKLGNLFLNDEMEVKIGDFGLATKVGFNGERKNTLCGTPNYIAPEVLSKLGHSYEVDVWSLGCIMYTLLVGKPPFETSSLKETYTRIKKNEYHIPSRINSQARNLIQKLLQSDPTKRPTMNQIMYDDFLMTGYIPTRLPTSCLTMAPRFDTKQDVNSANRKPLLEVNKERAGTVGVTKSIKSNNKLETVPEAAVIQDDMNCGDDQNKIQEPADCYLSELYKILNSLLGARPSSKMLIQEDEAEDPAAVPMLWVSKWVDYSDKYGLGYQLCDNSVGVVFNDSTKLILLADGDNIHYVERDGAEHYYTINRYPDALTKKVTLLKYFRNYMNEHLLKAGAAMTPRDGDELSRLPCLRTWFRTRSAIVLHLSNGTVQINFFQDHTKLILCPLMGAVTYINENREFRTFKASLMEKFGCSASLFSRLRYARTMVERLMSTKSSSKSAKS